MMGGLSLNASGAALDSSFGVFDHTTTCSHSAPCLQLAPPVSTATPRWGCRKGGGTCGIISLDLNI
eukprot:COSAG06_NODE_2794_length_6274_cov_2.952551_8_plen_65_part_01